MKISEGKPGVPRAPIRRYNETSFCGSERPRWDATIGRDVEMLLRTYFDCAQILHSCPNPDNSRFRADCREFIVNALVNQIDTYA